MMLREHVLSTLKEVGKIMYIEQIAEAVEASESRTMRALNELYSKGFVMKYSGESWCIRECWRNSVS